MLMQKITKVLSLALLMFAMTGMLGVFNSKAFAGHEEFPEEDKPDLELLLKFNLVAHPKGGVETDGKCLGNSSKVVHTVRGAGHEHIQFHQGMNNKVVDHCTDSIDGNDALVNIDLTGLEIEEVVYAIQLLGKPGGKLNFCTMISIEHDDPDNFTHCVIHTDSGEHIKRDKGKPGFTVPKQLFAEKSKNQTWSSALGDDLRLAKVYVFVQPAP